MILGPDGMPFTQHDRTLRKITDITKSYSFKLSITDEKGQKTYQSADFFCATKASITPEDDPEEVGRDLFDFCMTQVGQDIATFQDKQRIKRELKKAREAAVHMPLPKGNQ